MLTTNLQQH